MNNTKVVRKSLAGLQDMVLGIDNVQQNRSGNSVSMIPIHLFAPVRTELALADTAPELVGGLAVITDGIDYTYYVYSQSATTGGIKSTVEAGSWLLFNSGNYEQVSFRKLKSFVKGNTLNYTNDVLYNEADTKWYRWAGTLPKVVPANSTLASTGGVSDTTWVEVNLDALRGLLLSTEGASNVFTASGVSVEEALGSLTDLSLGRTLRALPTKFSKNFVQPLLAGVNPQGLAEDANYWYITEDVSVDINVAYLCQVSRISKLTNIKTTLSTLIGSHGQGIGVLPDGRVFVGGSANSKVAYVNFDTNAVIEQDCVGLYKDFPFCYDAKSDLIYQLQDNNATSANMTRLAVLNRSAGFVSDFSLDRTFVKEGYPQGIATDGVSLYMSCGGSYISTTGGTWNNYWTLYRTSLGGVILDRLVYRRTSMGKILGYIGDTTTVHEPQGLSLYNNKLTLMQYIGNVDGTSTAIFTEDVSGIQVRSIPFNRGVEYWNLDMLGIDPVSLTGVDALRAILVNMVDSSSVTFSLDNTTGLAAATGIAFGVCTLTKINANRAYAVSVESSSGLSATAPRGKTTIVHINGAYQAAPQFVESNLGSLTLSYDASIVLVTGAKAIAAINYCSEAIFNFTNDVGTNPVTTYKFSRQEIDYYRTNSIAMLVESGTSYASISFTTTGITVNTVTGNFILRRVLTH